MKINRDLLPKLKTTKTTSDIDGYSCNYIDNLHTYSAIERRIGTWVNGKPLYRKVINVTIPNTNTDGQISAKAINVSNNINKVIKTYGYIENTKSTIFLPILDY